MSSFERKKDYSKVVIDDVRRLVQASREIGKPILAIPNEECIICYYGCMPFVTIYEDKWIAFSHSYNKYFMEKDVLTEIERDYRKFLLNPAENWKNLAVVLNAIWKGLPNDTEKHTQHLIACNNQSFNVGDYYVCGVETSIPTAFMKNGHKPEIDFVALSPINMEMLMIEYKCKYRSLYPTKGAGIRDHWIDYTLIKRKADEIGFVHEMLNAYYLLCDIEGKAIPAIKEDEIRLGVAFLLTGNNYKDNEGVSKKANDSAIKKILKMDTLIEDEKFTDQDRRELLWYWEEDYKNVRFDRNNFKTVC